LIVAALWWVAAPASGQWTWTPQTGRWINVKHMPKETAELQYEYARSAMLEKDYKKALRETNKFTRWYSDTEYADDNQFLRGEIRLEQGNIREAAKELQKVVTEYPDSELYDKVIEKQYEIGDRLYEKGLKNRGKWWKPFHNRPLKHAIEAYGLVIDNQPFTNAAAEAQYKVGLCQFTRKDYVPAAYDYRRVIEDYPDSEWVKEASYGLAMCYHKASLPADYDQTPSELTMSAIDGFVERFPEDPRVEELKRIRSDMRETIARQRLQTAEYYAKRREFNAARLSYQVVVEQFADTEAAGEAQQWLTANPASETPRFGQAKESS